MMNKSVSACALTAVTGTGEGAGWMVVVVGEGGVELGGERDLWDLV